ncbi:putative membrane protein [Burkholderiales bacterium JOSHI_001]|nr:putative membrane protein [Burkholderiales bacterium JOSHI_001]
MSTSRRADRYVPLGLIALALIPVAAGVVRLTLLAAGGPLTVQNARFFDAPMPVVLHIVSVTVFSLLGAFQFASGFRRRWPAWHRVAGRIVVMAAFGAGSSGVWMASSYAIVPADSNLLHGLRLFFGWSMVFATARGLLAIRRGQVASHQAWMRRAYAIGLGAGTQALILGPAMLVFGEPDDASRALMMGAGWVLNLAVAEWLIRARS